MGNPIFVIITLMLGTPAARGKIPCECTGDPCFKACPAELCVRHPNRTCDAKCRSQLPPAACRNVVCDTNAQCVGKDQCACNIGYGGDGLECTPTCEPACASGEECVSPNQCKSLCEVGLVAHNDKCCAYVKTEEALYSRSFLPIVLETITDLNVEFTLEFDLFLNDAATTSGRFVVELFDHFNLFILYPLLTDIFQISIYRENPLVQIFLENKRKSDLVAGEYNTITVTFTKNEYGQLLGQATLNGVSSSLPQELPSVDVNTYTTAVVKTVNDDSEDGKIRNISICNN